MSGPDEPREPEGYDDAPPFRPVRRPPLLHRTVPVAREMPHYRLATVRLDLVAVTVAALAVPAAMAYAETAAPAASA